MIELRWRIAEHWEDTEKQVCLSKCNAVLQYREGPIAFKHDDGSRDVTSPTEWQDVEISND